MSDRRRKPEEAFHRTVAGYLDMALPDNAEWFHIPNGGKRSKAEAGVFKALGVKPGMPDIAVIYNGIFHGIELKAKGGRPSKNQTERHRLLQAAGARLTICWQLEQVESFLRMYMPLKASVNGKSLIPAKIRCERCTMTFPVRQRESHCTKSRCPDCNRPFRHGKKVSGDIVVTSIDPSDLHRWQQ